MKNFTLLILLHGLTLICAPSKLFAQAPPKEWDVRFGGDDTDFLQSLGQTSDGGYILGGYSFSGISGDKTQTSQSFFDFWIVKTNAGGAKLWDARFGGNSDDYLTSVVQTSDGGYILGGYSLSGISGDKTQASQGSNDYWIVKTDAGGTKQWDARFGGDSDDRLTSLEQTSDGGYILGGYSASGISGDKTQTNQGGYDYWIVKTDAAGTKQWDVRFGGDSDDRLTSFEQTSDGGYIFGGYSLSGNSGDKTQTSQGGRDYWMVKTDAIGSKLWDVRFGSNSSDYLYSLEQTTDSGFILGGYSNSGISGDKTQANQGLNDYWMVKTDSVGTKEWDARFGGNSNDYLYSLDQTSDGGFILGGYSYSGISGDKTQASQGLNDYWIVKTDTEGTTEWDARFGGDDTDFLQTLQQTSDGGYILGGYSNSEISGDKTQASQGSEDYWIVKLIGTQTGAVTSPLCVGSSVTVPYTTTNIFSAGNIFTVQLSNASGSFAAPVTIGTLASTTDGSINSTIPPGTPAGAGYRIRVVSSNPVTTGSDTAIQINAFPSDINLDGITNITDFNAVLGFFGQSCTCAADVNNDGIVNITDFNFVLGQFGLSCQ